MRLMRRDLEVLRRLAAARWLTTEQLHALIFGEVSLEMARRRLRLLRGSGYVRTRQDNRMTQALHGLGAGGRQLVRAHGWEGEIRLERKPPQQLRHLIGVNDIRAAVEQCVRQAGLGLAFFYAHWELEAAGGWAYRTIPDAVCEIEKGGRAERLLFEYDRGTEGKRVIVQQKFLPYATGLPGFPFSRVIFVTETRARAEQLGRMAAQHAGAERFVFLARQELTPASLLRCLGSLTVVAPAVAAQRVKSGISPVGTLLQG